MRTRKSAFDFFFFKIMSGSKMLLVALLPWFRDCHFDGSVSSYVLYVTCSHGTDCHAGSPAGRVHCLKMAKIDPVSPFYPTLWLEKGILQWENLQEVQKNEPLGCKISTFVRCEIGNVYTTDVVTVFDAILTSRQTREKLQCLYENIMSNNFRRTAFLKKIWIVN